MDNIPRGITMVLVSILFFVSLDTTAKLLTQTHAPLQVAWGRYLFSALLLPVLVRPREITMGLRSKRPWLQLVRSILLVSTTCAFFTAIKYIPLADAIAIGFASPLIATALAIPLLHEKVGLRRWSAIMIGFVGVMIVLRPGFEDRHWAYFLPLAVALMMATYNVLTRLVNRYDSAQTSITYNNITGMLVMTVIMLVMPGQWTELSPVNWGVLLALGAFGTAGHFCLILAYRHAPVSTLAPFSFCHIILAVTAGLVVFGEMPDVATLLGACVIAGSGIYVFRREALLSRQARAQAGQVR